MTGLQARITTLLTLMLGVALALVGLLLRDALADRQVSARYALMEAAAGHVNVAAGWQAVERGVGTTLLGQATPAPELLARFKEVQEQGDARSAAARVEVEALLRLTPSPELERRSAAWAQSRVQLEAARARVLTRNVERKAWIAVATEHIDRGFALREGLFNPRDAREQVLIYNAVLRAAVATLCEYAGRERANLGGAIASGSPLTDEQLALLGGYRALVDHAAAGVLALRADPAVPPGLAAAIDRFQEEFLGRYQALRLEVYGASRERRPYPVSGPEWIARSTRAIDTGLAISAVVGELSRDAAAAIEADASRTVRFDAALLAAAVLIFVLVLVFVRRAVVAPVTSVIGGLLQASTQITDAAASVSGSSQGLAAGASEQAAALEQTNATLEEVARRSQRNADHGAGAGSAMSRTVQVVGEGASAMKDMEGAMAEIREAAGAVSRILKTIEGLSFQTHLLALNASVEAARAGDQGRGFAVVAAEVGALAERSSSAARESAQQVAAVERTTAAGASIVERLGKALAAVEALSAQVSGQVGAIASESAEQARGVSQVNEAVTQMNQVVQRNAASAEESAAAAEQLSAQAETLRSYVRDLQGLVAGRAALT